MNASDHAKLLNELAHAEQGGLVARLTESTVFVSWASADEAEAVAEIVAEERQHVSWLIDLINDLGESPTHGRPDAGLTSIHFIELNYLIPRIIQNKRDLRDRYHNAVPKLSACPEAAALVGQIADRHSKHLATLEELTRNLQTT